MQDIPVIHDYLTVPVSFKWNDRTWESVTDAMPADEMNVFLALVYFPYDHESADEIIRTGGVFHVRGKYSFKTFYVHKQALGMVRLFKDTFERDYCNDQVY